MKRPTVIFYYIWKLLLILFFATACHAQTKTETTNTSQTKNANRQSVEGEKSNAECDFSSFTTLKETPGEIIALPKPIQPKKAKKIYGDVWVRVLVNREGRVEQACKLKGSDILAELAIKAAMQLRVTPEYAQKRLDMKKRDYIEFTITYNFKR